MREHDIEIHLESLLNHLAQLFEEQQTVLLVDKTVAKNSQTLMGPETTEDFDILGEIFISHANPHYNLSEISQIEQIM